MSRQIVELFDQCLIGHRIFQRARRSRGLDTPRAPIFGLQRDGGRAGGQILVDLGSHSLP